MPYTSHGHWYGPVERTEPRPAVVMQCGGPGPCPQCNQEVATGTFRAAAGGPDDAPPARAEVTCPNCGHAFDPAGPGVRTTESVEDSEGPSSEAMIDGQRSFDDVRELVRKALQARAKAASGMSYAWVYISDLTGSQVVYASGDDDLFQCSYEVDAAGEVTLGDPTKVVRTYAPAPAGSAGEPAGAELAPAAESAGEVEQHDQIVGRVIENLGTDASGGRKFRVRVIAYGDSKNRRRYPESVLRVAAPMYEGAKAYDHHRDEGELKTSTIRGLIGYYRDVTAESDGIYADLHLLPSAVHAAESLDATLTAQEQGLEPLIGVSHDVFAMYKQITVGGKRMHEATAITRVNSADLVADPAAGGRATRMVAAGDEGGDPDTSTSGTEPAETLEEDTVPPKKEDILSALREASAEELAALGLAKAEPAKEAKESEPAKEPEKAEPARTVEADTLPKGSYMGRLMIRGKVEDADLPASVVESIAESLPERIRESDVDGAVASLKSAMAVIERADLAPKATVTVTKESREKKMQALDAFFDGKFSEGYHSFKQAYVDFTGYAPRSFDSDVNRHILRESIGGLYDSAVRSEESLDTTSWAQVLGDSITRRMMSMYALPNLQTWRQIVSSVVPVNDFRTQRVGRVGGYGTLPVVNEGSPYPALTSPDDEEATYALSKRGGTEDLTLEMIANDDVRAISSIPAKLGRAAAQTLYRFVWDMIRTNPTTTYDGTPLFHASHGNTTTSALSESALATARQAMREQTPYGNSTELLDLTPRTLVVPPALELPAWKLTTSAVSVGAAGTDAEQSRTAPNMHSSLSLVVVPYFTADDNNWYVIADPNQAPTLEVGFYQGRQDPELFTQADPNQGATFNADKVVYKIRHIYSGTVLDHRAVYGGLVA
jgi:phage major head subunit gpT-like protein